MQATIKKAFHMNRLDSSGNSIVSEPLLPIKNASLRHEPPIYYIDYPHLGAFAISEVELQLHISLGDILITE